MKPKLIILSPETLPAEGSSIHYCGFARDNGLSYDTPEFAEGGYIACNLRVGFHTGGKCVGFYATITEAALPSDEVFILASDGGRYFAARTVAS